MKALHLLSLVVVTLCASPLVLADEYTELCRLFKVGTKISMPGSCDKYIECHNDGQPQVYNCFSSTAFDVKSQACVNTFDSNSLCANRCEGKSGVWVADPTNCHGFFWCQDGTAYAGHCEDDLHFDATQQLCIHSTSSSCVDVAGLCELVPDKTKFRDETDCSSYYECLSNKQSKKTCSKTYFDVETQSCVDKSEMTCDAHPTPSNVCGTAKKPIKGYVSDQATCRGFFYCADLGAVQDLEPLWGQCPEGKFFNTDKQLCMDPIDAMCKFNRCEGRPNILVTSSNNNCHNYIICQDGFQQRELTCDRDYFFNEQYQACVPEIIYDECCDIK